MTAISIKTRYAMLAAVLLVTGTVVSGGSLPEEFVIISSYSGASIMVSFSEKGDFGEPGPIHDPATMQCYGVGMADFDGDGDYDFVLGSKFDGSILYYEKIGEGANYAEPKVVGTYSGYPLDFAVADYNNDGNYDFLFSNFSGRAYLFLGLGDGTFSQQNFAVPANSIAADSADFNGDGLCDFAMQYYGTGEAAFFVFLNQGGGNFTMSNFKGVFTTMSWGLTAGDFDGDGIADILAGGDYYGTSFFLYSGNGDGSFDAGRKVVTLTGSDNSPPTIMTSITTDSWIS
jgi:hypothetical protein